MGGRRANPYNDLCGKGAPFSGFRYMKGLGFHLLTDISGRGLSHRSVKGPVDAFYGFKRDKKTFWFNTFKKTVHVLQLKEMQFSERSM